MTEIDHDELLPLRGRQEHEVATAHALTEAEHALAQDAYLVGHVFALAGVDFDPLTFVAIRIIEASGDGTADPVDALNTMVELGAVDRAVSMAEELLAEGA